MSDLETARLRLFELRGLPGGSVCPCCDQHVQEYRWSMYGSAVRGLFMMFHLQQSADDFVHINALKDLGYKGQGDGTRWKAWELAEEDPRRKEDGGRSGYWRLTDPGIAFLANELEIWKYIWTYNNAVIKYSGPPYMTMQTVSVVEALGKNFHYGKMLAGEF